MSGRSKSSIGCLGCLAIIIVFVIVAVIIGVITQQRQASVVAPFKSHLSEYASMSGLKPISPTVSPYIKGKVIVIDIDEKDIDDCFFDLPSDLRAASPEEVGTVIWLDWGEVLIGRYTDGAGGYQITCKVTVIDKAKTAIVGEATFKGSEPPSVKSGSGDRTGDKPTDDVSDYIKTLPRQ